MATTDAGQTDRGIVAITAIHGNDTGAGVLVAPRG